MGPLLMKCRYRSVVTSPLRPNLNIWGPGRNSSGTSRFHAGYHGGGFRDDKLHCVSNGGSHSVSQVGSMFGCSGIIVANSPTSPLSPIPPDSLSPSGGLNLCPR